MADCRRIEVVKRFMIPAFSRHRRDCIGSINHELPEACRVVAATRHATAEADDSDRLPCRFRGSGKTLFSVLEREESALKRRQVFKTVIGWHLLFQQVHGS